MATSLPVGFRPSPLEVKLIRRATADLGCSKSDLLRTALRVFVRDLAAAGFVSQPAETGAALAQR